MADIPEILISAKLDVNASSKQAQNDVKKIEKEIKPMSIPISIGDKNNLPKLKQELEKYAKEVAKLQGFNFDKVVVNTTNTGELQKNNSVMLKFFKDYKNGTQELVTQIYELGKSEEHLGLKNTKVEQNLKKATQQAENFHKQLQNLKTSMSSFGDKNTFALLDNNKLGTKYGSLLRQLDSATNLEDINKIKSSFGELQKSTSLYIEQQKILKSESDKVKQSEIRNLEAIAKADAKRKKDIEAQIQQDKQLANSKAELLAKMKLLNIQSSKSEISLSRQNLEGFGTSIRTNDIKQAQSYLSLLKTEYQQLNALMSKGLPQNAIENLNKKIVNMGTAITSVKNKFATLGNSIPADINSKIEKLRLQLKEIEKTDDVNARIPKYNALAQAVQQLNNQYKITAQQTRLINQNANLQVDKSKFVSSMDAWLKKNSKAVKYFGKDIENIKLQVEEADKAKLGNLQKQFQTITKTAEAAGKTGRRWVDEFKNDIIKMATWLTGGSILFGAIRQLRQMYQNIVEIDTAMTDLKKVTDETDAVYNKFLTNASKKAVELGASISDLVKSTADFARLGFSLPDSEKLAEIATLYKNVGDIDIGEATSSIISTIKAFDIQANDAIQVVDKFNQIGNKFAISSSGIGESLKDSASALKVANNTLDQSIALTVAGNNVIQDPSKVGNALKTVSLRLTNTKGKLEELGEESDGAAESVTKLQTQLLNLTKGKVNIMADEDTFKSTYDIMIEMSKVWDKMTQKDQSSALELISGKRQANVVAAIITNMSDAEKALKESLNSTGSARKEQEKWLESIDAKTQQFGAHFEELSQLYMNSDLVKGTIDTGSGALGLLTSITKFLGEIPTLVTTATIAMGALGKDVGFLRTIENKNNLSGLGISNVFSIKDQAQRDLEVQLNKDIDALNRVARGYQTAGSKAAFLTEEMQGTSIAAQNVARDIGIGNMTVKQYAVSQTTASTATKSLGISSSIAAVGVKALNIALNAFIVGAIVFAITKTAELIDAQIHAKEIAYETAQALKAEYEEQKSKLEELNSQYDEQTKKIEELQKLHNNGTITTEQEKQLENLNNEIELLKLKKDLQDDIAKEAQKKANKAALDASKKTSGTQVFSLGLSSNRDVAAADGYQNLTDMQKVKQEIKNYDILTQRLKELKEQRSSMSEDLYQARVNKIISAQEEFRSSVLKTIEDITKNSETVKGIDEESKQYLSDVTELLKSVNIFTGNIEINTDANNKNAESIKQITQSANAFESANSTLSSSLKSAQNAYKDFQLISDVVNKKMYLTTEQVGKLIETYPELKNKVSLTTKGWTLESSALDIVNNSVLGLQQSYLDAQKSMTEMLKSGIETRLKDLGIELKGIKSVADAYKAMANVKKEATDKAIKDQKALYESNPITKSLAWTLDSSSQQVLTKNIIDAKFKDQENELVQYAKFAETLALSEKELQSLQGKLSGIGKTAKEPKSKKEIDAWKEDFEKHYKALQYLRVKDLISDQKYHDRLTALNNKYFKGRSKYLDEFRQYDTELYNLQKQLSADRINDLQHEISLLDNKANKEQNQIAIYKQMQDIVHKQADEARARGISDNDEYIQNLQKQWWDFANKIVAINKKIYDSGLKVYDDYISDRKDLDNWGNDSEVSAIKRKMDYIKKSYASGLIDYENYVADMREITKSLYNAEQDALNDVLEMTKKLEEQNNKNDIEALEKKKDKFREIIELQKESLEITERQRTHDNQIKDKTDDIAKLKKQADEYELDDSREAKAKRQEILDQIAEKQKELTEYQHDYSIESQQNALDKELENYENEKDDEIDILEKSLNTSGKLYQAAIKRINTQWDTLQQDLLNYNKEYGSALDKDVLNPWNNILDIMKECQDVYGKMDISKALDKSKTNASDSLNNLSPASSVVSQMKSNAQAWNNANPTEKSNLESKNVQLANQVASMTGKSVTRKNGVWYIGNEKLFDVYHTGGIVGGSGDLKQNELMAILEKKEIVLDKPKQNAVYNILGENKYLSSMISDKLPTWNIPNHLNNISSQVSQPSTVTIDASVNIAGNADESIMPKLKQHKDELKNMIFEGFGKNGFSPKIK